MRLRRVDLPLPDGCDSDELSLVDGNTHAFQCADLGFPKI